MSQVKFKGSAVMSEETANKTGNLGQRLFNSYEKIMDRSGQQVKGLGDDLESTNPFQWNSMASLNPQGIGIGDQFPAFMQQAHMAQYYQNNPWPTLTFSQRYGVQVPLGGEVRGDVPPGSYPGNIKK